MVSLFKLFTGPYFAANNIKQQFQSPHFGSHSSSNSASKEQRTTKKTANDAQDVKAAISGKNVNRIEMEQIFRLT